MFCAFDGRPNIVRLHGTGRVVTRYDPDFKNLAQRFDNKPGARAVIVVDVHRVSDSCGWGGVPLMSFEGHRDLLDPYFERKALTAAPTTGSPRTARALMALPPTTLTLLNRRTPNTRSAVLSGYLVLRMLLLQPVL